MSYLYDLLEESHKKTYDLVVDNLKNNVLPLSSMFQGYFTDHGVRHCKAVQQKIEEIIIENKVFQQRFGSLDALILLLGIWLHDIGRISNLMQEKLLSKKLIAKKHHVLSYNIVKNYHYQLGILDENIADIVARVVKTHSWELDIDSVFPFIDEPIGQHIVRPRVIAVLLRYGDNMDCDYHRAPSIIVDNLANIPPDSRIHWIGHNLIIGSKYRKGVVTINARFSNKFEEEILYWKLLTIYSFFQEHRRFLNENRLVFTLFKCQISSTKGNFMINGDELVKNVKTPVDIRIIEKEKDYKFHTNRKEYFFAADISHQLIHLYQHKLDLLSSKAENQDSERSELKNKIETEFIKLKRLIAKAKGDNKFFYFVKEKLIEIEEKEYRNQSLSEKEKWLKKHNAKLSMTLDFLEEYLEKTKENYCLVLLLRCGYSPRRYSIKNALDQIESELNKTRKGIHSNCVLCSGRALLALLLANEIRKKKVKTFFRECLDWFKSLEEEKWRGIEDHKGKRKEMSYEYTRTALEFFLDHADLEMAKRLVDILREEQNNWLKNCEHDALHVIGYYLFYLCRYYRHIEDGIFYTFIVEQCYRFLDMFNKSESNFSKINGLLGLLTWSILGNDKIKEDLKTLSYKYTEELYNDPLWVSNGSHGWDTETTKYRAHAWLQALNVFCEFWEEDVVG